MSASDKKKLRAAERAEKMTEKQQAAQKEAKKLKLMTTIFVVVLAAMICFAAVTAVTRTIENSGVRQNKTVAVTIGNHEISNAELNYYYIDTVNNFYSQYGSYSYLLGLDVTAPLDEQVLDEATGKTWADDFIDSAVSTAKSVYALNDAAAAAGFTLSDADKASIDNTYSTMELYAMYYGYSNVADYLRAMYGAGSSEEGFRKYLEMSYTADAFQNHYYESLTYTDADLREAEADDYNAYSSYSYNSYYLSANSFDDTAAAEAAAKELTAEGINTVEALDAAIAGLSINKDTSAASTANDDVLSTSISSLYAEWLADSARKNGDVAYFANTSTSGETTTVNGYYIVMFRGSTDNNFPLVNVRHILAAFEGGSTDSTTGVTTYSDEEKMAAKADAEALLGLWQVGDKTEESFAILANANSEDGDGTTGGLYENIYPGQMVTNFNNWCFDSSREAGDTDIVETNYGYHVMYFSGESDVTYRDYMIENDLKNAALTEWYNGLVDAMTFTMGNTKYMSTNMVLSAN